MDLSRLSIWAKIRTFSAGVWHNLILSFICYILIQSRDAIFDPFYSQLSGFVVQEVSPDSSISGEYGIEVGDVIHQINDCNFTQSSDIDQGRVSRVYLKFSVKSSIYNFGNSNKLKIVCRRFVQSHNLGFVNIVINMTFVKLN